MSENYRFNCPKCGRKYKANKDLSGRHKKCGKCRHTFSIAATAKDGTVVRHAHTAPDPELSIDDVFSALHEWQRHARSLPGAFAREVTFGHFEPAYRVTLETTVEEQGRRVKRASHKESATLPPELADDARRSARVIADLPFAHSAEALERVPVKPLELRRAAEELLRETQKPPHLVSRRLLIEHLNAWKTHWGFRDQEGNAWFSGKPLRLHLPDPPRRSLMPAAAAVIFTVAALGAGAWAARELDLFGTPPPAVAAPVPAPASLRARPEALRFAKDGILLLDEGSFLRGALERKDDAVVVSTGGRSQTLPTWQIETVHLDAPVFVRGESRRLDDLEGRVKGAGDAKREILVGLFLEVHRQRDRWARLEALCTASELPAPAPQRRLETLRVEIERLLEKSELPAIAAPATPAAVPAASAKGAEPSPSAKIASDLLAQMMSAADADSRQRVAGGLRALKGEKLPPADLLHFAVLYLARSESDAGLVSDRLRVKTAQTDSTIDGTLEKNGDAFIHLRTPSGQDVTAYREKNAWVAQLPGGLRYENAQCTATPAARTASGEQLRAAFDRLPPSRWMSATGGEHLRAAKAAAEAKGPAANDRGMILVRYLAAAHAATALRSGSPAEILEARGVLHGLGYAPTADGRWERAEDRRAVQLGQSLRDSKVEDARALVPAGRSGADFFGAYRAAAVQLQAPLRSREDVDRAASALEGALVQAATAPEGRHLLALKAAISGFGVCRDCGGGPAKICMTCRGKGTRTEACAACRGLGYIVTVGIGASGAKTCESCGGKPIKGTRPCERCEGKGTRSCPKCQGVAKFPSPADLGRTAACGRCSGAGGAGDLVQFSCPTCAGLGLQLLPAGAPDATLP
jgi:hypothetical protein